MAADLRFHPTASATATIAAVIRSVASRFLDEYRSQLRPFEAEYEVAPGVVVVQRLRTRPRGGGPRQGPPFAGAGGDRRAAGGHSPAGPVRLPGGGRWRCLSLGTGRLGLLTAC
jgi:hypothetical protein